MKIRNPFDSLPLPALCGLVGCVLGAPAGRLAAATANISIGDNFFNPTSVMIKVNDQVQWNWSANNGHSHSTTSTGGLWDSMEQGAGFTYTHTFASAGNFPFLCTVHPTEMQGSVTVTGSANVPPTVTITSPQAGATFAAPWTGTIKATSGDADGTVSRLDFFAGATLLGSVANPVASQSFTATNLAAGNYTLTAVATDDGGASTPSAGIAIHVVTPSPIVLSAPAPMSPAGFQFRYTANPGLSYAVLRSLDLVHWTPLGTNVAASGSVTFLDSAPAPAQGFYRVRLLPNP